MVNQLLLSKWLFMKGEQHCVDNDPVSAGLAISLFQDAIEIFIWSLVKKFDSQVNEKTPFLQYFDKIKQAPDNENKDELPHHQTTSAILVSHALDAVSRHLGAQSSDNQDL